MTQATADVVGDTPTLCRVYRVIHEVEVEDKEEVGNKTSDSYSV